MLRILEPIAIMLAAWLRRTRGHCTESAVANFAGPLTCPTAVKLLILSGSSLDCRCPQLRGGLNVISLASRWTLTPGSSCRPVNQKTWWSAAADIYLGSPQMYRTAFVRLVHESTHSNVIHDAQG